LFILLYTIQDVPDMRITWVNVCWNRCCETIDDCHV